eukprot:COSAG04_NODE_1288_length_7365_cov_12.007707_2_plen_54_part_00
MKLKALLTHALRSTPRPFGQRMHLPHKQPPVLFTWLLRMEMEPLPQAAGAGAR